MQSAICNLQSAACSLQMSDTGNVVGTRPSGECFHSFLGVSQSFTSVFISPQEHEKHRDEKVLQFSQTSEKPNSVAWDYLKAALQRFNFGPDILTWFEVIYNNASSCVLHNGHASDFFLLERGVRQGFPLSGLLFVIGTELISNAIQKDPTIKGIQVGKTTPRYWCPISMPFRSY